MAQLPDEKLVEVVSAINIFDTVGDGSLPLEKLIDCLRSLGLNPLKSEVKKIVTEISDNGRQSRIDIDEFLPIYEYFQRRRKPTFEELCEGLKSLNSTETDEGSIIQSLDLQIALTSIGDKLTREECKAILSQVVNKKKEVNIEKLVRMIMEDDDSQGTYTAMPHVSNAHITQQQQQQGSKAVFQILD